jgi:hypothetical protein
MASRVTLRAKEGETSVGPRRKPRDLLSKMTRIYKMIWRWAFLACFACLPARAQDTQFIPEVDGYLKLNSVVRTYLQAKDDREGGEVQAFSSI